MLILNIKEVKKMKRNDVLKELYGSRFWKDIKSDFVAEAKKANNMKKQADFFAKWSYYYMYDSPTSTIKGRSLEMRKALIEGGLKDNSPILEFFKMPSELYTQMNKKYDEERAEKLLNDEKSEVKYADLADKLLKDLLSNINDNDTLTMSNNSRQSRELAYQKLIVLAIATGRRQIELLKMLEISKKKDLAIYKNLAKKKDSDADSVVAPILIDVNIAKRFLNDVKAEFQTAELTNKQVNSKYNASISKALFRYLPDNIANKGFHFLRALYAEACYEKFADGADKNLYFTEVLGHELKLNAAHSYQAKTV